jgi:hypothetical protein
MDTNNTRQNTDNDNTGVQPNIIETNVNKANNLNDSVPIIDSTETNNGATNNPDVDSTEIKIDKVVVEQPQQEDIVNDGNSSSDKEEKRKEVVLVQHPSLTQPLNKNNNNIIITRRSSTISDSSASTDDTIIIVLPLIQNSMTEEALKASFLAAIDKLDRESFGFNQHFNRTSDTDDTYRINDKTKELIDRSLLIRPKFLIIFCYQYCMFLRIKKE